MIKLQVIGNLGKDCLVNSVNGKTVINFSVAHTETYRDRNGEKQSKTTWVDCSQWTERTGIAPYLKKGTTVFVEGTPEVKEYDTKDGRKGSKLTLRVSMIELLGSRHEGPQNAPQSQPVSAAADITEPIDDLPF